MSAGCSLGTQPRGGWSGIAIAAPLTPYGSRSRWAWGLAWYPFGTAAWYCRDSADGGLHAASGWAAAAAGGLASGADAVTCARPAAPLPAGQVPAVRAQAGVGGECHAAAGAAGRQRGARGCQQRQLPVARGRAGGQQWGGAGATAQTDQHARARQPCGAAAGAGGGGGGRLAVGDPHPHQVGKGSCPLALLLPI